MIVAKEKERNCCGRLSGFMSRPAAELQKIVGTNQASATQDSSRSITSGTLQPSDEGGAWHPAAGSASGTDACAHRRSFRHRHRARRVPKAGKIANNKNLR
jgi:hypothetical protein